jgi:hypothetical protein
MRGCGKETARLSLGGSCEGTSGTRTRRDAGQCRSGCRLAAVQTAMAEGVATDATGTRACHDWPHTGTCAAEAAAGRGFTKAGGMPELPGEDACRPQLYGCSALRRQCSRHDAPSGEGANSAGLYAATLGGQGEKEQQPGQVLFPCPVARLRMPRCTALTPSAAPRQGILRGPGRKVGAPAPAQDRQTSGPGDSRCARRASPAVRHDCTTRLRKPIPIPVTGQPEQATNNCHVAPGKIRNVPQVRAGTTTGRGPCAI